MFQSFTLILSIAALFSYINYRWLKLPATIGLMIMAMVTSLFIIGIESFVPSLYSFFCELVLNIDFKTILLDVMLSFLLFAGAMHVNITELEKEKWAVLLFATFGVLISTFLVGGLLYGAGILVGMPIPFIHCLLFGALISPTDPIAVISILKSAGVSKSLELKIEGESLFNDGVGVVVFTGILLIAEMSTGVEETGHSVAGEILLLFGEEALGGIAYGALLGYIGWQLIRTIEENAHLAILLTLAIAMGGYSLASLLHVSGPLAMVVAGLIIGHQINSPGFSAKSRESLNELWEVLDDTLNAVLFVLIGLMVYLLNFSLGYLIMGVLGVVIVLIARFISVSIPYFLLKHRESSPTKTTLLLAWGGLRGGISVALALSLAEHLSQDLLLFITYCIVLFSIIVQGMTIGKIVKALGLNKK